MDRAEKRVRQHHPHHHIRLRSDRLEMLNQIQRMPCRERTPTLREFPRNRDSMLFGDILDKNTAPETLTVVLQGRIVARLPPPLRIFPCADRREHITSYGVSAASYQHADTSENANSPDVHVPSRRR